MPKMGIWVYSGPSLVCFMFSINLFIVFFEKYWIKNIKKWFKSDYLGFLWVNSIIPKLILEETRLYEKH